MHAAIIGLGARTLGKKSWVAAVKPTNEEEALQDSIRDPGMCWVSSCGIDGRLNVLFMTAYGVSKFRVRVLNQLIRLRKAVVSYIGDASNFTGVLFCAKAITLDTN